MIRRWRRKCHQPSGSSRPFIRLQHLVDVRDRDRHADRSRRSLLGHHEPVRGRRPAGAPARRCRGPPWCRDEAPVALPGLVVDLAEDVQLAAQRAGAILRIADPVLGLELLAPARRSPAAIFVLVARCAAPTSTGRSPSRGRRPRRGAGSRAGARAGGSSARSSKPSISTPHLVVHREVHRADHAVAPALAQPGRGGIEQRPRAPPRRPRARGSRTCPRRCPGTR